MKTKSILNPEVAEAHRLRKHNQILNSQVKKLLQERGKDLAFIEDLKSVIPPSVPFPHREIEVVEDGDEFVMTTSSLTGRSGKLSQQRRQMGLVNSTTLLPANVYLLLPKRLFLPQTCIESRAIPSMNCMCYLLEIWSAETFTTN